MLSLVCLQCCVGATSSAQERHHAPSNPSSLSPLKKLELLHQSVKRKLKSALGVKDPSQKAQADHGEGSLAPAQSFDQNRGQYDERLQSPYATRARDAAYRQQANRPAGPAAERAQVVVAERSDWERVLESQQNHAPAENPMRPVEYREYPDGVGGYPNPVRRSLPPPITELSAQAIRSAAPPYPPSDQTRRWNGGGSGYADQAPVPFAGPQFDPGPSARAPLARGSVLGLTQVTATQHALRLIEENGDMKGKIATISAENQRLKEKLAENEQLLQRSTGAVQSAHEELESMSATNRDLQKNLSDAESRHNRYLLETDRMLQSIREELDNVLVREISAKGN